MKKITLSLIAFAGCLSLQAQNFYNFAKTTSAYTELTGATSINNNQVWMFDEFGPINTPFPVFVFGTAHSQFEFNDDEFIFTTADETTTSLFSPVSTFLADRNFSLIGDSQSPLSYKVEGTAGSRILKLEVKNAGLEDETESETSTHFINYQIWFYEADRAIEYHFGPHNITDLTALNNEGILYPLIYTESEENEQIGLVNGTIANPVYNEFTEEDNEPTSLDAMPAADTVYRFTPVPASVNDNEQLAFNLYPNPAKDVLHVSFKEMTSTTYEVYDLIGKKVVSGTINNATEATINIQPLQTGAYLLKLGNSTKKFIKK